MTWVAKCSKHSTPIITALMSVYNGCEFLGAAIESVLQQSFNNFELLIINDGSTEPIEDIILDYKDDRIRLWKHPNIGLTRSLNVGLELARGEYIARMDSDDLSLPRRFKTQIETFRDNHSIDLVGTSFDIINENGEFLERKNAITDDVYRLWRLLCHNNYGHGAVMFRKNAVMGIGNYDAKLKYAQDYDLWSRLSTKTNTKALPDVYYQYRLISQSKQASVRNYDDQLAAAIWISNRNLRRLAPDLSETDCAQIRSLYWNFQISEFGEAGLKLIPEIIVRFLDTFRIDKLEKPALLKKILDDVQNTRASNKAPSASFVIAQINNVLSSA